MARPREAQAFRTDRNASGEKLTPAERERLLQPYLSAPTLQLQKSNKPTSNTRRSNGSNSSSHFNHKQRFRPAIRHLIYSLIFTLIHALFSVYVRLRRAYNAVADRILAVRYHHHRTPEIIKRDVQGLSKVPRHLSVILQLPDEGAGADRDRLEALLDDACEIVAWTASAGIPMLSIYERTGALKHSLPHLHRRVSRTLTSYFGAASPPKPSISLRAPHLPSYSPPSHSPENVTINHDGKVSSETNFLATPPALTSSPSSPDSNPSTTAPEESEATARPHITILLLDHTDGRQTLVDLTKTLADMSQHNKLTPSDISSELIDAEISESVMQEPDLLVMFGERVVLEGYPPWQARLTEMMCMRDNATSEVGYHLFLRALYRYARAEFRVGR